MAPKFNWVIIRTCRCDPGTVFGSARLQIYAPTPDVRVPAGQVPYCLGTSASQSLVGYTYPSIGTYSYSGASPSPQGTCIYADGPLAIPDVFQSGGGLIPTRLTLTPQSVGPQPLCAQLESMNCTWSPDPANVAELTYLPDAGKECG